MTAHEKHMEFHRRNDEATKLLMTILPRCIPEGWREALLELTAAWTPHTGALAVHHSLTNPGTQESVSDFPAELFEATAALHQVFAEFQQDWKRAAFNMKVNGLSLPQGYEVKFTYGPP